VVVAIRLHNQHSNDFREEQQQNADWSGLLLCVQLQCFSRWGPSKAVHYTPSGLTVQSRLTGLWLFTCHITNIILIFRATGGKIWG
jgi:hypothetical protein